MEHEPRHMTDERLASLLDEALAPAEPSPALAERIAAASCPTPRRRAVVTRIGDGLPALAAAAMIALVMLGAWAMLEPHRATEPTTTLTSLERELSALDEAALVEPARLDEQIELLELQLELASTDPLWPGNADPLEEAGAQAQVYSVVGESLWHF